MSAPAVYRSVEEARRGSQPCALAIGNFDGVHLGHRVLLSTTTERASRHRVAPTALTFDPHPTTVVAPERVPLKLCSLQERIELLKRAGAERIVVLPFTSEIARLTPEEFVRRILVDALRVKFVLVGENFRFGVGQSGDAAVLRSLGDQFAFEACLLPPVLLRGEVVSSSAIRRYLAGGQLAKANRMLGRCFSLAGPVVSGFGIGSRQTVPTLNIRPIPDQLTPRGVFITETYDTGTSRRWQSITNIGNRPTFSGEEITVETYLISPFSEPTPDEIRIDFRRFVREERQFPDPPALRAQILRDVGRAQAYWRRAQHFQKAAPSIY